MAVKAVRMPRRDDGSQVPNPTRYVCNLGHLHPSHRHAVACNVRHRPPTQK